MTEFEVGDIVQLKKTNSSTVLKVRHKISESRYYISTFLWCGPKCGMPINGDQIELADESVKSYLLEKLKSDITLLES